MCQRSFLFPLYWHVKILLWGWLGPSTYKLSHILNRVYSQSYAASVKIVVYWTQCLSRTTQATNKEAQRRINSSGVNGGSGIARVTSLGASTFNPCVPLWHCGVQFSCVQTYARTIQETLALSIRWSLVSFWVTYTKQIYWNCFVFLRLVRDDSKHKHHQSRNIPSNWRPTLWHLSRSPVRSQVIVPVPDAL